MTQKHNSKLETTERLHSAELEEIMDKTPSKVYLNSVLAMIFTCTAIACCVFFLKINDSVSFNYSVRPEKNFSVFTFYSNKDNIERIKGLHMATITETGKNTGKAKNNVRLLFKTIQADTYSTTAAGQKFPSSTRKVTIVVSKTNDPGNVADSIRVGTIKFIVGHTNLASRLITRKNFP